MKYNNIVLMAGKSSPELVPTGHMSSMGLVPLRGKPSLGWVLESVFKNGAEEIILVLNKNNKKQTNYIKNIYSKMFKIKIIEIGGGNTILHSLKAGLDESENTYPTRIILGDTLINQQFPDENNLVLTSKEISFSNYWCVADKDKNNNILNFYDKKKNIDISDKEALVGYYSVSDTKYLKDCVRQAITLKQKQISSALEIYKNNYQIKTQIADEWLDLGHSSGIIMARNKLFNSRYFNNISIDADSGTLVKKSTNKQKLEDEAFWYNSLPDELKIFVPRLINFSQNKDSAVLTQELYGYLSLQDMFLFGEVNLEDWALILTKLFDSHKFFEKYKAKTDKDDIKWLYETKTTERISLLKTQNGFWNGLLEQENLTINNKKYANILTLKPKIDEFIQKLIKNSQTTIIHGDYCFSNILFDSINFIFKFIDPRGRLSKQTIYGDSRYDIAKLRHSVIGKYDFIVNDLFCLCEEKGKFFFEIFSVVDYSPLKKVFDDLTKKNGFDIIEIKFIEALLFLTMIPLHKDSIQRQKMFYLKSVILFNEILNDNEKLMIR